MISEQELNQLKDELYRSNVIFSWEYTGFGGRRAAIARWIGAVFSGLIPFILLLLMGTSTGDILFFAMIIICLIGVFAVRYLFMADRYFRYNLTSMGIHYTEQVAVPDTAYAVVRGFAWVGMAVCVVALVLIGPLAFVGVGGCALLSFGLTNFKPQVEELEVYFSDHVVVFDPIKDTVVEINTTADFHPKFIRTIFFKTFDDKKEFIECLKNCHDNVEHHQLKRLNDQYKHPMFNRELTDD